MKLRNIALGLFAFASLSLTSCKDENKTETNPDTDQQAVPASNTTNTTAALNPAHGQPGHRCEIPVGAPLDQAPATTMQQQQTTTPVSSSTSPVRLNSTTATPLKNPPHGQPGHDCAVPVGADLPQQ